MEAANEDKTPSEANSTEKTTLPMQPSNEELKSDKKLNDANTTEKGREISTKEAYFASLNEWVKHANISQNAMALFPWYLISSYPQMFQQQAGFAFNAPVGAALANDQQMPNAIATSATGVVGGRAGVPGNNTFGGLRILDDNAMAEFINRTGGYEYVIAPFWKRAIAEMIDVFILLLFKIIITFTIVNIFDLDLGFDLDKEVLRKAFDDDDYTGFLAVSMDVLAFSSDLLMLEVLTKILVCFYEAFWTRMYNGATPGKAIMNIRIQYVEAVLPLQPAPQPPPPQLELGFQAQRVQMRALIFPAETPTFKRAVLRAVAKNLIMTLLFPMCFLMIFFKNNRTAYDIITKTIVVENNPNPVLRRQR